MNFNLLFDYNLADYSIFISGGLILGCSIYYLIRSNYIAIPSKNMEALTHSEMETVFKENLPKSSLPKPLADELRNRIVTDSSSESEFESEIDYQSTFDSDSSSEFMPDLDDLIFMSDTKPFIMPDVDFNICSIEELKLFEFNSLYANEILEHSITDEDIMEFLGEFSKEDLASNWINDFFIFIINQTFNL